jgi:hypothetical protein
MIPETGAPTSYTHSTDQIKFLNKHGPAVPWHIEVSTRMVCGHISDATTAGQTQPQIAKLTDGDIVGIAKGVYLGRTEELNWQVSRI